MIKLLGKLFIKKDCTDKRYAYGLLCSAVGIVLNVVLFIIKFIAGNLSGAISVTADAFNNLSDSGSSIITMLGFRVANIKPDKNHPFGHGRIEYLSGLIVSMLIILMGFELFTGSIDKIIHPEMPEISAVVFIVLGISVLVKLYMFAYNRIYGKKYNSGAMLATSADSVSDAISSGVVFVSMIITYFTHVNIDAWCGLAVSAFVLYAGIKSAIETISPLLGQPPEEEFVKDIEKIVLSGKDILGLHDLIVHDYGPGRCMISLHAEVPSDGDIFELHDSIDNIEKELTDKLGCEAVIHMDPIQTNDETVNRLREMTLSILNEIDSCISMHDFRVVEGPTHTNIIFDVVVPMRYKLPDDELKDLIGRKLKEVDSRYCTVITVDKDYAQTAKK